METDAGSAQAPVTYSRKSSSLLPTTTAGWLATLSYHDQAHNIPCAPWNRAQLRSIVASRLLRSTGKGPNGDDAGVRGTQTHTIRTTTQA